jgi:hypothetical protein
MPKNGVIGVEDQSNVSQMRTCGEQTKSRDGALSSVVLYGKLQSGIYFQIISLFSCQARAQAQGFGLSDPRARPEPTESPSQALPRAWP